MIFNSDKKQSSPFRVQIGSNLINSVNSTKYLGIHLDNELTGIHIFQSLKASFLAILVYFIEFENT